MLTLIEVIQTLNARDIWRLERWLLLEVIKVGSKEIAFQRDLEGGVELEERYSR